MSTRRESSSAEPSMAKGQPSVPAKKRRTPGACDNCKRKKIRCDSAEMLGNRCSSCIQFSLECTHKEVSKTLGSAKGYVESLEIRLEKMEKLLGKLLPQADLNQELENIEDADTSPEFPLLPRNDNDILEEELVGRLKRLHVDPPQGRFFGKSSGYQLVQTALDIRREFIGKDQNMRSLASQRAEFWFSPPWHPSRFKKPEPPNYAFPDDTLLSLLVDAYFTYINSFFPLLHRPSFEQSIADGLHHHDESFGGTVLLVCALGSRYSDDPRVLYPGTTSLHSAGWKWFEQVPVVRKSFVDAPSLGELQHHALSVLFSQPTETPQGCWTQLGMALRMAQEVGAHRRRTLKAPTAEDEHWKRVFWVLMSLDRLISSFSGRQCVLQEEDYDVDRPIECDDEYWNPPDPSLAFRQPADKPSAIAFFNCYLKLTDILARAMRLIYSVKQLAVPSGQPAPYFDQKIIMDLDSAMNSWMDSVPDHLRWNPSAKDKLFLKQSATLYATYYHLQIFIHRPFIPSFRNRSPTTFPSLAICTNAARSCCHVIESQGGSELLLPTLQATVFTAAVVLLLNIWSGKRSGFAPYPQREIDDVQRCLKLLKACERRWCSSGRYRDILKDLASAGDLSFADSSVAVDLATGTKRPRDLDDDSPQDVRTDPWSAELPKEYRKVAGLRRVWHDLSFDHRPPAPSSQTLNFELPMYAIHLGRLPVFGQFNFSESFKRPRPDPFPTTYPEDDRLRAAFPYETRAMAEAYSPQGNSSYTTSEWDLYNAPSDASPNHEMTGAFNLRQPGACGDDGMPLMDSDTLTMWSTAPTGFGLNEWGTYITSVDQMTHAPDTTGNV
ncbi:fungal-specific transcription factor domain-containing protein [Lyophyllum atratum]|nr:fungal-specific transcription factor domain-containing protein [Lyophyllum atratum]